MVLRKSLYSFALLYLILSCCSQDPQTKLNGKNFTLFSMANLQETDSNLLEYKKNLLAKNFRKLHLELKLSYLDLKIKIKNNKIQKVDNFVYMLESPDEHVSTQGFSQKFVITRFPIVNTEEKAILLILIENE